EAPAVSTYRGILVQGLNSVLAEALPTAMPPHIEVDVANLTAIDDAIHIRDLTLPADVEVHADPETLVVKVAAPAVEREVAAEEEVAAAEAEVEEVAAAEAEEAEESKGEGEGEA
ncbi:MAG: 50S ribosomal protein L25, partial [Dehalococcoidia bacterium]